MCSPWSLEADDLGVHPVGLCLFQIGGDFVLFVVIEVDLCDCYAAVQIFRGFGGSCLLQIVAHSLLRLTLTPPPPPMRLCGSDVLPEDNFEFCWSLAWLTLAHLKCILFMFRIYLS